MRDRDETARILLGETPLAKALGLLPVEVGDGTVTIRMPYDEALIGDPETRVIHGGAISALMDTAGGGSVLVSSGDIVTTATLDLRIDYMRAATPGQAITARAVCYNITRHVAFVRISATDDDPDHPVAAGTGVFTVERQEVAG